VAEPRTPWSVPDEPGAPACRGPDVRSGLDSDDDGAPDSLFTTDGDDLLLHTDLGADGLADRTVRLRADGTAAVEAPPCADGEPSLVTLLVRILRGGRP
jgi:hypothetical protein